MEAFNNNFVLDLINFGQWKKREQKKLLPWEEKWVTVEGGVVGEKEVSKGKGWDDCIEWVKGKSVSKGKMVLAQEKRVSFAIFSKMG